MPISGREDGFVTNMHEVAAEIPEAGSNRYHVPFLNPGSNTAQESKLRLINPGSGERKHRNHRGGR